MRNKRDFSNYILIFMGVVVLAWAVGTIIVSLNG